MKAANKPGLNAVWHEKHPMPINPTIEGRMKWHLAHAKHCNCRSIPLKLTAEIKEYEKEKAEKNYSVLNDLTGFVLTDFNIS